MSTTASGSSSGGSNWQSQTSKAQLISLVFFGNFLNARGAGAETTGIEIPAGPQSELATTLVVFAKFTAQPQPGETSLLKESSEMSFTPTQAFVGAPVNAFGSKWPYTLVTRTPRRCRRYALSPMARSLDSYREGNRFGNDDSTRRSRNRYTSSPGNGFAKDKKKKEAPPPRRKLRVPLVNALCSLNVASLETCAFLIRSGCVRVNGEVVNDQKAKVHRFDDDLVVNGKGYGTVSVLDSEESLSNASDFHDVGDPELLPRAQRDFRNSPREGLGPESFKKYNRRVDRGFFSSRRYHSGK